MEMTTVETELMNHQSIVNQKEELVSVIFSLVIMEIAFHEFTFVVSLYCQCNYLSGKRK